MLNQHNQFEMETLFPLKNNFRIVELRSDQAKRGTDEIKVLKELIVSSSPMYPKIESWFSSKVIPGLKSSERIAYVAYEGHHAIASAVLKLGNRAKFCHLRIHQDFHDLDVGQMFFTQITLEARHYAREIHFTLPEGLWHSKKNFFEKFGFFAVEKANRQYRLGEEELSCSAPIQTVWASALEKLPNLIRKFCISGYSLSNNLLMSIKPKYAEMILSGAKHVEIRRKFSTRWIGSRVVLYASSPMSALVGEARVKSVVSSSPDQIWNKFGKEVGCSWDDFAGYTSSASEVCAIEIDDVVPYRAPVTLSQISHLVKEDLRPPQSYSDLKIDQMSAWGKAVSIASLLHGRFGIRS